MQIDVFVKFWFDDHEIRLTYQFIAKANTIEYFSQVFQWPQTEDLKKVRRISRHRIANFNTILREKYGPNTKINYTNYLNRHL